GALTGRRAAALPQPARGAGEPLEDRSGERMIAELERDAGGVVERIEIVREAVGELEERLDQRAAGRAPLEPRELAQGVGVRAIVGERAAERGLGGLRIAGALTRPRRHLALERATERGLDRPRRRDARGETGGERRERARFFRVSLQRSDELL